jgi:hypothetical protein
MAAANLITTGTTAATSADIVLADGASILISLKSPADGAEVHIDLKDDASVWQSMGRILASDPAKTVYGPGTFRARRIAGASCGVFSG